MKQKSVAIVGAAESTEMGKIPDQSELMLQADAALNALEDAGLKPSEVDGLCGTENPAVLAHYLGIVPKYVDGTQVGGCSFMLHVRHAAAALNAGLCETVLIVHGESGRSRVGRPAQLPGRGPETPMGQFEAPYGVMGPPTTFTIPWLRYAKRYGISMEQLAMVAVVIA